MRHLIFTEEFCQPENFYPFTLTRQIQDLRVGILTIREKWERWLKISSFDKVQDNYKDHAKSIRLSAIGANEVGYLIHSNLLPSSLLVAAIAKLKKGDCLVSQHQAPLVYCVSAQQLNKKQSIKIERAVSFLHPVIQLQNSWELLQWNDWCIREDFKLLTKGRKSAALPKSNRCNKPSNIFIEKGAHVEYCLINATEGPVYIAKGATLLEGSMLRGPLSIGANATIKMGAKIYGATCIGPSCTVGGEIKNSILLGFSNKAHEGYLGDSIIGEWCNLGAGTSNSNIKNSAGPVRVQMPNGEKEVGIKAGTLMGDYVRTSINSSINTGTVIGAGAVLLRAGLTPRYIPSFAWGEEGITRYEWKKVVRDIERWKALKGEKLGVQELKMIEWIYNNE
jgi:UDP-N-acetylglucosamine diphosphorylase/glucosamine-1-phosphate N-acetyltransferase